MKRILSFAAAAIVLVGCQSDEFTGNVNSATSNEAICFNVNDVLASRATTTVGEKAAALLNNNFIVYGFKYAETEKADGTNDQKVFDLYNVNYETASANLTQSNTNDWEYVGYKSKNNQDQTIKYWDYSAKGYVFSAISGLDVTVQKVTAGADVYSKGWKVTVPAGGSLVGLYASNRVDMPNEWNKETNDSWRFANPVNLQFYSLASKIRFAMYETVSGYSVKVNKFYYGDNKNSTTNFVVDGKFKCLDNEKQATATVTYYSKTEATQGLGVENCPKVKWADGSIKDATNRMFGTNIQCNTLGTTSAEATYDQAGGEYTYLIPFQDNTNTLSLKVDYTLTSTDGSGEVINVYGATASVPANYTQWKENFAYTYVFKISDKTNGSTTPDGPEGLYPITFDACVVSEEDGVQETVTSFGEPAITTYAKGEVATKNADYAAGDVYFAATQSKTLMNLSTAANVYEVYNYGKGEITEALVNDYEKNYVVLIPVTATKATAVPLNDGSSIAFADGYCYKFAAQAGKTYAIQVKYDGSKYAYKVVKVAGSAAAPTYTLAAAAPAAVSTVVTIATLKSGDAGVVGAMNQLVIKKGTEDYTSKFSITEGQNAGEYKIALTEELINEGANATYTVNFQTKSAQFTVESVKYTKFDEPLEIVAGKSKTFQFGYKLGEGEYNLPDAVIVNDNEGITVTPPTTQDGPYNVSVAKDVAYKAEGYSLTIAGQQLKVNVTSFKFNRNPTFTFDYNGTSTDLNTLLLTKNGETPAEVPVTSLQGINTSVATFVSPEDGKYTITPVAGGSFTVTYENASAVVTVNKYTMTADAANVKVGTGSTNITLRLNGEVINASAASVEEKDKPAEATYSLTTNGKVISFGNATKAGEYNFYYKVGDVKVATVTITVNP